jgi:hypothetical protein
MCDRKIGRMDSRNLDIYLRNRMEKREQGQMCEREREIGKGIAQGKC